MGEGCIWGRTHAEEEAEAEQRCRGSGRLIAEQSSSSGGPSVSAEVTYDTGRLCSSLNMCIAYKNILI